MNRIDQLLRFLILMTVCLSGLLLGMGQQDFEPLFIAAFGAGAAWILVDWLKWFHLPQWLANILAIIVTIVTVSNFYFTADSVRHLLGVGKLLVYLQSILLFKRKSARVYWQVLVLSLLQIVVGAVFNLGFEGGVLFILYMLVAGLTMMVLSLYQDQQLTRDRNSSNASRFSGEKTLPTDQSRPLTVNLAPSFQRGTLRKMIGNFSMLGFGALVFAIFLFYFLPREHSSWSGPQEAPMGMTGFAKKVSLNHPDMIVMSSRLQMNVRYWRPGNNEPFLPEEQPYLRGMALSNLKVVDNKTSWIAPPYQVFDRDFRPIPFNRVPNRVIQDIVLEPTSDPLLYSAMPPRNEADEPALDFDWCWPLGALTRQKESDTISVTNFRYKLEIPILDNGDFFGAWPYAARSGRLPLTMESDPGNYEWLTWLEKERYPVLISTAKQLVDESRDDDHLMQAKRMEAWFLDEQRFVYTLDYRGVERNPDIDSVEDFVANFRTGHCEYYASALALMLRSQGIPSRVVIGYRGGDVNEFGGHLDVEERHAHSWVEAYIRPEDCTPEMIRSGQASQRTGAWLRLDPTPAVDNENDMLASADDALGFAKSLWRDYVLGLQADRGSTVMTPNGLKMSGVLRILDLDWWQKSASGFGARLKDPAGRYQILLWIFIIGSIATVIWFGYRKRGAERRRKARASDDRSSVGWFRRRIADVLGTVSPRLGDWVIGSAQDNVDIPFYSSMVRALKKAGYERASTQTQREFAMNVAAVTAERDSTGQIGLLTKTLTDYYYLVRFGKENLDERQGRAAEKALAELEDRLRDSAANREDSRTSVAT